MNFSGCFYIKFLGQAKQSIPGNQTGSQQGLHIMVKVMSLKGFIFIFTVISVGNHRAHFVCLYNFYIEGTVLMCPKCCSHHSWLQTRSSSISIKHSAFIGESLSCFQNRSIKSIYMHALEICSLCLIGTGNFLALCTSFLFLKSYGQEHGTKSGRENQRK